MAEAGLFLEARHLQDAERAKQHQMRGGSHSAPMPVSSSRMEALPANQAKPDPSVKPPHHTGSEAAAAAASSSHGSDIDYAATSSAIMDALVAVDGHVSLTPSQKERAIKILKGGSKAGHPLDKNPTPYHKASSPSHEYLYYLIPIAVVIVIVLVMNRGKMKKHMMTRVR